MQSICLLFGQCLLQRTRSKAALQGLRRGANPFIGLDDEDLFTGKDLCAYVILRVGVIKERGLETSPPVLSMENVGICQLRVIATTAAATGCSYLAA